MSEQENCRCSGKVKLIFACSGASDVGEITDRSARKLAREGAGKMFCLTGIGGRVETIMKFTKAAHKIVAINGCALNCTTHCLKQAGFTDFAEVQLGALGFEKGMSPADDENIEQVAEAARQLLTC